MVLWFARRSVDCLGVVLGSWVVVCGLFLCVRRAVLSFQPGRIGGRYKPVTPAPFFPRSFLPARNHFDPAAGGEQRPTVGRLLHFTGGKSSLWFLWFLCRTGTYGTVLNRPDDSDFG